MKYESNGYSSNCNSSSVNLGIVSKGMMRSLCDEARNFIYQSMKPELPRYNEKFKNLDYKRFQQIVEDVSKVGTLYPDIHHFGDALTFYAIEEDTLWMYDCDFTGFATENYSELVERIALLAKENFVLFEFIRYSNVCYATFIKRYKNG